MLKTSAASCLLLAMMATMASAECNGRVIQRPTKSGVMRDVCLDGKYSTCIKDSLEGGWTRAQAKDFCDKRKAAGAIK